MLFHRCIYFLFYLLRKLFKKHLKVPNRGVKLLLTILQYIMISESSVASATSYNHLLIFFSLVFFSSI